MVTSKLCTTCSYHNYYDNNMKCNKAPATRNQHNMHSQRKVHRKLNTQLYGTNKGSRITGSSLAIAGTGALFIPVVGWAVGGALIGSGVVTSIASSATADPYVTIRCGNCGKEGKADEIESFMKDGCESWCMTCGVKSDDTSTKCCLVLCHSCEA